MSIQNNQFFYHPIPNSAVSADDLSTSYARFFNLLENIEQDDWIQSSLGFFSQKLPSDEESQMLTSNLKTHSQFEENYEEIHEKSTEIHNHSQQDDSFHQDELNDSTQVFQGLLSDTKDISLDSLSDKREVQMEKPMQNHVDNNTWLPEDDQTLFKLAIQYKNDWRKISKRVASIIKKHRSPQFLKKRFTISFDSQFEKRVKFSHEEDLLLAKIYKIYPGNWLKIADSFPMRTPMMLKNRYYSYLFRKGKFNDLVAEGEKIEDVRSPSYDDEESVFQAYKINNLLDCSLRQEKIV